MGKGESELNMGALTTLPGGEILRREDAPSVLQVIARAAADPTVDVAKMTALLDMQERILAKQSEIEFNHDFSAASLELPHVSKRGVIKLGAGKGEIAFAKYEDLDRAIRPIEAKYGFTRSFSTDKSDIPGVLITVHLRHRAGHSIQSTRQLPPDPGPGRNGMQAIGSAGSYGKRYLTVDIWNIITEGEDNDATSTGLITDDQADTLRDLMHQCGMDADNDVARDSKRRLLALAEVTSIENLPAGAFKLVRNQLMAKVRK